MGLLGSTSGLVEVEKRGPRKPTWASSEHLANERSATTTWSDRHYRANDRRLTSGWTAALGCNPYSFYGSALVLFSF